MNRIPLFVLVAIAIIIDFFTHSLEYDEMAQSTKKYGVEDGDTLGHRMITDFIGKVCDNGFKVEIGPHPATDGEVLTVSLNRFITIGRHYYYTAIEGRIGDPTPNRVSYAAGLYDTRDPKKRPLKAYFEYRLFKESPEGIAKAAEDDKKLKARLADEIIKVSRKLSDLNSESSILKDQFKMITGEELTDESFSRFVKGEDAKVPSPSVEVETETKKTSSKKTSSKKTPSKST